MGLRHQRRAGTFMPWKRIATTAEICIACFVEISQGWQRFMFNTFAASGPQGCFILRLSFSIESSNEKANIDLRLLAGSNNYRSLAENRVFCHRKEIHCCKFEKHSYHSREGH